MTESTPTADNSNIQPHPSSLTSSSNTPKQEIQETPKRERTMAEFLALMDNYAPIIPDAVTDYYLSKSGFDCDDVRIKRLLALATQKFIADIATDAFQHCKVRQSGNRKTGKERKTVLTMEDLSAALAEYGVNVKKPEYYS
ncbi:hypothetical protein G6F70_007705 [Rhizopus microsporus]|uniref:Transcription initiation factor TFIID subunit 10 n=1 Tax=Rhizopus microsporus TaxID=58291 RepID=A0A1X0RLL4_RHIZD|nr:hypothetical protein G6F71_007726 [Rhizopus microsporus]KAG1196114.1 hypothetical protein G6F70_007705 [Rhizopus microsporus]KAG1207910.1 hypothetical protein G6F69_007668 [Rhizopus microsporus]KAG1228908.1 hypothetical protein G6F67_007525 [Rhizopus microsporus]KAG1260826.1 hypothetical protein G6F68_007135 [Rhizopus microsporus]